MKDDRLVTFQKDASDGCSGHSENIQASSDQRLADNQTNRSLSEISSDDNDILNRGVIYNDDFEEMGPKERNAPFLNILEINPAESQIASHAKVEANI